MLRAFFRKRQHTHSELTVFIARQTIAWSPPYTTVQLVTNKFIGSRHVFSLLVSTAGKEVEEGGPIKSNLLCQLSYAPCSNDFPRQSEEIRLAEPRWRKLFFRTWWAASTPISVRT